MRILILTYYSPPCNSVASHRLNSFVESLLENKHEVTIVTRGWHGNENSWRDFLSNSPNRERVVKHDGKCKVHYLPYKEIIYKKNKLLRRLVSFLNILLGNFSKEVDSMSFYKDTIEIIKEEDSSFDYLITSSPPINIVKLGFLLRRKYRNIKWIADFRDLQNHIVLAKKPNITFFQKIEHLLIKIYFRTWLKQADSCIVASEPFKEFLQNLGINSYVLLNGFNEIKFDYNEVKINPALFEISVLGTLYPKQDLNFFVATIFDFLKDKDKNKIRFNLIGTNSIPEVASFLKQNLGEVCNLTDRVPIAVALKIGLKSSVLIYPGWKGYKGMYSSKFFDYLGLRRPILIIPSDEDVLENLINTLDVGKASRTVSEGVEFLNECYAKWLVNPETLVINQSKKLELLDNYSRRNQNKVLLNLIENIKTN